MLNKIQIIKQVPITVISSNAQGLCEGGKLCDVLELMGIEKPVEMTGELMLIH